METSVVADYAASLLARLGVRASPPRAPREASPAALWARSGAMALTGHAAGAPLPAPGPLAACAEGALSALRALAPDAPLPDDGAGLLSEHAACFGYTRRGRTSPGGSCRLLRCADGSWLALNLARPDDLAALPAWLESESETESDASPPRDRGFALAERALAGRPAGSLLERAALLSLPVAPALPPPPEPPDWIRVERDAAWRPGPAPDDASGPPLVLDLTALWAGPLCTSLLRDAGARVVKVESTRRPDGARANPRFFALLNAGKASVALDLRCDAGRAALHALLVRADVVVESARPRALRQLGVDAHAWLAARPGRTLVSITGYGRRDPEPGRVAFGDDAAAAAGLAWATGARNGGATPLFCADAIADPLTGLHAALAAWASWRAGGGRLLDLALRDVAGHALAFGGPCDADGASDEPEPARPPRAREVAQPAAALGADTHALLGELGC